MGNTGSEHDQARENGIKMKKSINEAIGCVIELYMYAVNIDDADLIAECSVMNSKLTELLGKVDDLNHRIGGRK